MPLGQEVLDRLSLEDKSIPTVQELQNHYAVMLNEFLLRVRDKIDNGNVEEVTKLISSIEHIDQFSYAIESLKDDKDKLDNFMSKNNLEEIVDRAVEKVHEKLQAESKSAVARKLKLDADNAV